MEPDGDLPCGPVEADPLDDGLYRLDLSGTIHLPPLGGIKDSALRLPDPPRDRFLDSARGKRFTETHCPALALRVQAHVIGVLANFPFRRAADILSRVRSPISSRSNCANESRMFSVSRPSDVLVLNCWVTATKLTLCFSNTLSILVKSSNDRLRRSTLYTTTQSSSPASTAWSTGVAFPGDEALRAI